MAESVHGHEVMELMLSLGKTFTKESLENALHEKFGKDAQYHTCSAEKMSAAEIIDFLNARGKFISSPDGFQTDRSKICSH